jgi:serine/threonine-protein kinase
MSNAPATTPARAPGPAGDEAARIGDYDLLFELAHGGMGTVHLGRATGERTGAIGFERLVAIKRLHPHLLSNAESVERFLQEARVAARVHHANVVGVHQVGRDEHGHFLVQDYVEGDTLEGLIDASTLRRKRLPPPIVLRIALDALAGLHAVHEAADAAGGALGIVHRDVSTQNLLVGRDGVTRLADFGIAKYAQSSVVTDARYLQGRVLYMPPEYLGRRPVDRRFDIYGLGITLWIALAGAPPWPEASDAQIVRLATTDGIPPLSESGLAVAPPIEALVATACHIDPELRFPTARAMLEAIESLGRDTGWIASHAEVAELVEALAGRELSARRAAVARASSSTGAASVEDAPAVTHRGASAPPRRRGLLVMFGATLSVAAALLIVAAARRGGRPVAAANDAAPTTVASAVLPAASTAPAAPAPVAPRLSGEPASLAAPRASARPSKGAPSAAPRPSAIAAEPVSASPRVIAAPPLTAPPPPEPAAPPLTIGTANPYH